MKTQRDVIRRRTRTGGLCTALLSPALALAFAAGTCAADFAGIESLESGARAQRVAAADMNGDGIRDIVVVEGDGGQPFYVSVHPRTAQGTFLAPVRTTIDGVDFPLPNGTFAIGDIDLDGYPDALFASTFSEELLLCIGNGDGTLAQPSTFALPIRQFGLALADFDGDGALDLIAGHMMGVEVLLGDGFGSFNLVWQLTGEMLNHFASADFNRDGALDFAGLSDLDDRIHLGLGIGDGTFVEPLSRVPGAGMAEGLACADVTGDRIPDIISWGLYSGGSVSISKGAGDGTFPVRRTLDVPPAMAGVHPGDFDEDGIADLLCVRGETASFEVRLGRESLATPHEWLGVEPGEGAAGVVLDVDEDGHLDFLVPSLQGKAVALIRGLGDGTFASVPARTAKIGAVIGGAAADFDGDGLVDLAGVTENGASIAIFLGESGGRFAAATTFSISDFDVDPSRLAAADFDEDGLCDLFVAGPRSGDALFLAGRGDGSFAPATPLTLETSPGALAGLPADFDGDGHLDLAAILTKKGSVALLLGAGDGTFRMGGAAGVDPFPSTGGAADLDGDGLLDVLVACGGPCPLEMTLWLASGRGDGTFAARQVWRGEIDGCPGPPEIGDPNADGIADAIVPLSVPPAGVTPPKATGLVFLGTGGGDLAPPIEMSAGDDPWRARLADLDRDGFEDLVVASPTAGSIRILRGAGDGTFGAAEVIFGGAPREVYVRDLDGNGTPDLAAIGGCAYALINRRAAGPHFIRGDIGGDGFFELGDAISLLGYLFADGREPGCLDAADANDNGLLELGDAMRVLLLIFANGEPLPPPYPGCGADPTAQDPFDCSSFPACP
ncbi:MAG: VCBS repeat-containing protein [Planctomycetes bacterium]|nr:VCBS repeat-containing protein [Planctomycetota bacterium]